MKYVLAYGLIALLILGILSPILSRIIANRTPDAGIRTSFANLKLAMTRNDMNEVTRLMSPGTMALLESSRDFGLNPDAGDTNTLSQLEVLIGFDARWRLGVEGLTNQSAKSMLARYIKEPMFPLAGLTALSLRAIHIEGDTATAQFIAGGVLVTNAMLPFRKYDRQWKLELDKFLMASEPNLALMRNKYHLTKPQMAVYLLESTNRQEIKPLRELLLAPPVRRQIDALKGKPASNVYDVVIAELGEGRQDEAEDILNVFTGIHTNDQRLAFTQAVCTRSSFARETEADRQFQNVLDMDPRTLEGRCARFMLDLDKRVSVEDGFKGLRFLASETPDDPMLHWVIGVACRDHYKHTGQTNHSVEGIQAYRQVLKVFKKGPALLHVTYANILGEVGIQDEALRHRLIAVELAPKSWTYEGLADTLSALKKYDEANEAYAKLVELVPDSANYWHRWAYCLLQQRRWDDCIAKCKKSLECDPGYYRSINDWGAALQGLGKLQEALDKYEEAIRVNPVNPYPYDNAVEVLLRLGDRTRAEQILTKRIEIIGVPPEAAKALGIPTTIDTNPNVSPEQESAGQ